MNIGFKPEGGIVIVPTSVSFCIKDGKILFWSEESEYIEWKQEIG